MTDVGRAGPTRILLVDDHPMFRDGLRRLIETEPGLEVIGEAGDGQAAVDLAASLSPDLVLLDMALPGVDGIEAIRRLAAVVPNTLVLLLTAGIEGGDLREALRYGARGLVLKTSATAVLMKAIRAVMAGEHWVSREIVNDLARTVAELRGDRPHADAALPHLTPREREVVALIVDGLSNKDIAARLSISEDTVKHHLTSTFDKTGLSTRLELALYALAHGLNATGHDPAH